MKGTDGVILTSRPCRLDGSTKCSSLAGGEADSRHSEDIGTELTPEMTLGSASGDTDFGRGDAECTEALETVSQT